MSHGHVVCWGEWISKLFLGVRYKGEVKELRRAWHVQSDLGQ